MERRGNTKRFISALLAFVMVLSLAPGSVLTAQAAETGLCEHHMEHTPACGYRAASEGAPCKYDHLCDKDCGGSHARDCAYTRELEKDLCNQDCTDTDGDGFADHGGTCAFTQAGGVHTHSDSCGYRAADAGSPCAFQCGQCAALTSVSLTQTPPETTAATVPEATTEATVPEATTETTVPEATTEATVPEETLSPVQQIQALIAALPEAETITAENVEAVKAQLTAIENAWVELTEEELTALDITRYITAVEAVSALEGTTEPIIPEDPEEATVPEATTEAIVPEETLSPVQRIQALIAALPEAETITAENAEAVKAQLTAIENAWAELTEEEMTALDISRYIAAVEAVSALGSTAEPNEIQPLVGTGQYQFDLKFINIPSGITVTYTVRDESGNELIPEQTLSVTNDSGSATVHADVLPIKIKVAAKNASGGEAFSWDFLSAAGTWTCNFSGGMSFYWTHDHTGEEAQWVREDDTFHILTYPCGRTEGGPEPHEFTDGICLCGAEQPVYTVYALLPGTDSWGDAMCYKAGADTGGLEGWYNYSYSALWVFSLPASYQGEIYFQWNGMRFPEGEGTLTLGAEQGAWFYDGGAGDWSLHSEENHFFLQDGEPCAVCGKTEEYSAYELYAILPNSGTPLHCFAYLNDLSSGEPPVHEIPMTYNPAGYWYCQLTTDQSFASVAVAPEGAVPVEAYYIPSKPKSPPEGITVPDPFVRKLIYDNGSIKDHDRYYEAMASFNHYRIDGTCIVCGDSLPLAAAVEGKRYTSLEEAWNAACDAYTNKIEKAPVTITLLGDATVENNLMLSGEELILEGGEYTVTFDLAHNIAINSGKLTLNSGTIENKQGRAVELNGGSFVMNGGTIVATGNDSSVGVWGNGGTVTISGGSVYGQKYAVQCNPYAHVTISGGSFRADTNNTAGAAGLYVDSLHVKLSGGTFDSVQCNGPLVNELLETGYAYYSEDGNVVPATGKSLLNVTVKADASGNLDLRNVTADQSGPGYSWNADTHTLTLQNANIAGDIIFADNIGPITVRVEGDSKVGGDIKIEKGDTYTSSYEITIQGPGALNVAGHLGSDGANGNQITIDTGAVVTAAGGVSANQGAGVDGTLTVRGTLTAIGNSGPAVYIGNVEIDGGTLNVSGAQGVSVGGMPGGNYNNAFVIKSGTFNANCANYNLVCSTNVGGAPGIEPGQVFNIPSGYLPTGYAAQKFEDGAAVAKTEGVTLAFASGGSRLTLSANQASGYKVTVENPAEGGTATASAATAREFDKIILTPQPAAGYHLAGWQVRTADGTSVPTTKNTFIMPASNVTVTPVFAKNGDLGDAVVTVTSYGGPEIYNGRPHTPVVTVRYNGTTLIRNRDYTVEYSNNVNAGEAIVTVTGMGNYTGSASANFTIRRKQVTAVIMAYDKTYDGNTTAVVTATVDTGIAGQNLTLSGLTGTFEDPDVGDGKTVTINSVPYFTGDANTDPNNYDVRYPTTVTASIDRAAMTVTASGYTGVYDALPHGITVTAPQDAAVTYGMAEGAYDLTENPAYTDAGTYTVYYQVSNANYETVTGSAAVEITPKTVNDPTIELSPESFIYDGTAKMPSVTVKDGDNVISDREYAVSYTNNTNAGNAAVTIEDLPGGNYTVSGSRTFTISKASLTGAAVELEPAGFAYDGTEKTPAVTVKIGGISVDPSEYSIAYSNTNGGDEDHTSAGTVTVTITAKADGNYSDFTSADFQITQAGIPEITLSPASAVYSGTVQKPAVTVGSLILGTDYDVSYTRNDAETTDFTNAGDIKITVTGKGSYTGTKEATYPIAKAVPVIAWSSTAQELTYTGQAAAITAPTVTLVNWETFSGTVTYSDAVSGEPYAALPTNAGTYTVKASIAETDNYTAAETVTPLTLTIAKADPTITFADYQTITYGGMPTGAAATSGGEITYSYVNQADPTQTGTGWPVNAGTYTVTASVAETDNYKSGSKAITLTIRPAQIPVPTAKTGLVYTGSEQTGVEAGTGYALSGGTAKDAGNYNATAALDGNHAWVGGGTDVKTISWSIAQKDVTVAITAENKTYDGQPFQASAALSGVVDGETVPVTLTYTKQGVPLTAAPADAGSYTVTASIPEGNYSLSGTVSRDFTIAKAGPGLSVPAPAEKTYADADFNLNATQTGSGALTYTSADETVATVDENGNVHIVGAGSTVITVTSGENDNYQSTHAEVTVNVRPKTLTPSITATEKVYDGTTNAPDGCAIVLDGVAGDDDVTAAAESCTYDSANAGDRTITATGITLTGADKDNYKLSSDTAETAGKITKRTPVITFADQTVTYGETPTAAAADSNGAVTYSYEDQGNTVDGWPTDAGTYTVTASVAETDNYLGGGASITLTINRKPIRIPEAVAGLIYNGQTQTGVEAGVGYTLSGSTAKDAGNYNATAALDGNHVWDDGEAGEKTIPWSIGKRDVTVAITAGGGVYSGKPFPATAILSGTAEGENVSVTLTYTDSEGSISTNAPTDVGTYTVTAAIADGSYALTGPASADFTITHASITGASVTVDGTYTYTGAEQTPDPTVTLGGKTLVKDTDYTVTYANNTDAGSAKVTVTGTGNYEGAAIGEFTIGKAAITDISATVNSVSAPEAQGTVQSNVTNGSGFTAAIEWIPEVMGQYGFNTAYTAALTLAPDENHAFGTISADSWTVADGANGVKTLTKTFQATRKEKITAVIAPTDRTLNDHAADANAVIARLPAKVTVTLESGGTAELPLFWSCDACDTAPNAENTFTWTVTDAANYDASGVTLTGTVTVTNPAPAPVTITGKNTGVTYDGSTIDVSALFAIDKNAGTAAYTVTNGTGTGTLAGSSLTVTKAGTFTVTVSTAAQGIYDAGTAAATLTVNKGTGEGSVTMEGWTYGGTEKEPVPISDTNGIANVTYAYSLDGTTIAEPAKAGTYTVTASFGATDLYHECTASADFTIDPKPITVAITPNGGVYGGEIKAAMAELKDLAAGDTVPVTLTYTGTANDGTEVNSETPPALAGTYTVTAGIPEGDYILTGETSAQFRVSRAESLLKVEPVEGSKTYGDEDFSLTVTREGTGAVAYASDSESVVTVDENGKIHIVGVGTAKITVTVAETDNYAGAAVEIPLTVAKRKVRVTVDSKTKIYGEPDPELTYTVEKDALVGTDTLRIEMTVSGKDVGAYDITASNAAGDDPNYEITFEKGQLTVEAREISDAQVVLGPALTANGKEQTQTVKSVTVTNSKGETLDVTYDVTGNTQTNPGGYEMTITGTGNFTGIKKQSFAIAPGAGQPVDTDSSGNPVLGDGTIIVEVRRESGAPVTNLGTPKAQIVEMLTRSGDVTAQELAAVADGAELRITFPVRDGVSADDQAKIEALARGYTVGSCFDITMYKQLGGGEKTYLHETGKSVTMTVQVPDRLLNTQRNVKRTFWTVRCHDGNAEFLPTRYNGSDKTLSFETDRFSGYAIVYKDTKTSDNTQNTATGDNPRTGDNSHIEAWITVMALSAVGIAAVITVKRKKRK